VRERLNHKSVGLKSMRINCRIFILVVTNLFQVMVDERKQGNIEEYFNVKNKIPNGNSELF